MQGNERHKGSSIRKAEGGHYRDERKGLGVNNNMQREAKELVKHERGLQPFHGFHAPPAHRRRCWVLIWLIMVNRPNGCYCSRANAS